jgi:hypothetical protein
MFCPVAINTTAVHTFIHLHAAVTGRANGEACEPPNKAVLFKVSGNNV